MNVRFAVVRQMSQAIGDRVGEGINDSEQTYSQRLVFVERKFWFRHVNCGSANGAGSEIFFSIIGLTESQLASPRLCGRISHQIPLFERSVASDGSQAIYAR